MAKDRNYMIEWATIPLKPIRIALILIVIAAILIYTIWFHTPAVMMTTKEEVEPIARLIEIEGQVDVKTKERLTWESGSPGTPLQEGDKVQTGPDSKAKIVFQDKSEITIEPQSIVAITANNGTNDADRSTIRIESGAGSIDNKAGNPTTISTPMIRQFRLPPGSAGNAQVDPAGDRANVSRGIGEIVTHDRKVVDLRPRQQVTVDKNNQTKLTELPAVPWLFSPTSGQVFEFLGDNSLHVQLNWRQVRNAVAYRLQISESHLFAQLSGKEQSVTQTSLTLEIPKTDRKKQYFWRVRSVDAKNNMSDWSVANQFVVQAKAIVDRDLKRGTPPQLEVRAITPYFPFVQVQGITSPGAFLTLNGQVIDVRQDGSFIYMYPLSKSGVNELVFVAEDPYGLTRTVKKQVDLQ